MTAFALVTTHATVLAATGGGTYDHLYHEDATDALIFDGDGHLLSGLPGVPSIFEAVVALPGGDRFAFGTAGAYLSAIPEGGFRTAATVRAWENFTRVPLAALDAVEPAMPLLVREPRRGAIPRLIHQTFPLPLPREFAAVSDELRRSNPGWAYAAYTDEDQRDFIRDTFGADILQAYLRISPNYSAARADLFRYLCMYHHGGCYLDIKSTCSLPLGAIVRPDDAFVLCQWDHGPGQNHEGWGLWPELSHVPGGEFQQWHIIAAPGHPFLEAVILSTLRHIVVYDARLHGTGKRGTMRVTGPILYTRAIHPLLEPGNHRFLDPIDPGLAYSAVEGHAEKLGTRYAERTTPLIV